MLRLDSPSFWKDYRPENGRTRGPRGPQPGGSPALPAPLFSRGRRGPIPASTPGRRLLDSPGRPTKPAPGPLWTPRPSPGRRTSIPEV
jgi:hypothetical protein